MRIALIAFAFLAMGVLQAQTCPSAAGCKLAEERFPPTGTFPFAVSVHITGGISGDCTDAHGSECRAYRCYVGSLTYTVTVPAGSGPYTITNWVGSLNDPTRTTTIVSAGTPGTVFSFGDEAEDWKSLTCGAWFVVLSYGGVDATVRCTPCLGGRDMDWM
jgi:hypothetical protein